MTAFDPALKAKAEAAKTGAPWPYTTPSTILALFAEHEATVTALEEARSLAEEYRVAHLDSAEVAVAEMRRANAAEQSVDALRRRVEKLARALSDIGLLRYVQPSPARIADAALAKDAAEKTGGGQSRAEIDSELLGDPVSEKGL